MYKLCATMLMAACPVFINQAYAITLYSLPDTGEAPTGFISNQIKADSDFDITAAEIFVELDTGTIYNPNLYGLDTETTPQGPGDTYVTIGGNSTSAIAGGAGDLGHAPATPGVAEFGPTTLGVTYFDLSHDDIGLGLPLGTFSFSDNATGQGYFYVRAGGDGTLTSFTVNNGLFSDTLQIIDSIPTDPPTDPTDPPTDPTDPPIDPTDPPTDPPKNLHDVIPSRPSFYFDFAPVTSSVLDESYIRNTLVYNDEVDWTSAALTINLISGEVYNQQWFNPMTSQVEDHDILNPLALFVGSDSILYDSYVTSPGDTQIAGGAGDLGGGPFSLDNPVSVSWFDNDSDDIGNFALAQFTLSTDAYGYISVLINGQTYQTSIWSGIVGGIPEPSTLALIAVAGPVLLKRYRV